MRNISTDALHPWDRSMWTDSLTPLHEQFGMTAIEARLDRWYFDGPGDNGDNGPTDDPSQAPDYTGLEDVQGDVSAADAATDIAAASVSGSTADMSGFDTPARSL